MKKRKEISQEHREKLKKQARKNKRRGSQNQVKQAQMMNALNAGAAGGGDGINKTFSFEFKSREKSTTHNFMDQAEINCPPNKIPAVVIHKNGDRRKNDLICIKFEDWSTVCSPELYKPPKKKRIKLEGRSSHI